jgi:hypothetical protein
VNTQEQSRIRAAAAWICMLAVTLLYAPLAGAALLAHGVDCCAGGYCTIPEHRHHKQQNRQQRSVAPQESPHADCGHDMSGVKPCSMSCCQDQARPVLMPSTFLLPTVSFAPEAGEVIRPVQMVNSLELSRFVKPLSPPPRFASSIL